MTIPSWVKEVIDNFKEPETGKVVLSLEYYKGGVTKIEIGGIIRVRPE